MAGQSLPPELVSLVHHVELNRAGWWEKATQRLIVSALWISGKTLTPDGIRQVLQSSFGVAIRNETVRAQLTALCNAGTLVPLQAEQHKISESSLAAFVSELKLTEELEKKVEHRFVRIFTECCPTVAASQLWDEFSKELLMPLMRDMGARAYELITAQKGQVAENWTVTKFIERYPIDTHHLLRLAIVSFLDPKDADVRAYVLRHLNAYFLIHAGDLPGATIKSLSASANVKQTFVIFADTNFLFSLMELRENPANEAALSLRDLIGRVSDSVDVRIKVLPITIGETQGRLETEVAELKNVRFTPNLAKSADSNLSGFAARLADASGKANRALAAEEFFRPYIAATLPMLRRLGVELQNDDTGSYEINQVVLDDMMAQVEFERKNYGTRAKSYEKLRHDIVLWHYVHDKRSAVASTPLDVRYWVVTLDFRYMAFDRYKRRKAPTSVPVCVPPTSLVQMLQFWVPRSQELEETLLGSFRIPFLFQEFDPEAERIALRILEALSRFQDVGDLSQEAIASVLMDQALRKRIRVEDSLEKRIELVKQALVQENLRVRGELKATLKREGGLKEDVVKKTALTEQLRQELSQERAARTNDRQVHEAERQKDRQRLLALERSHRERETADARRLKDETDRKSRVRFLLRWGALLGGALALLGAVGRCVAARYIAVEPWRLFVSIWAAELLAWVLLLNWRGARVEAIALTPGYKRFRSVAKVFRWVLLTVAAASASNFVTNWFGAIQTALGHGSGG